MTDKELKKLSRSELLEMLIVQTEKNEMLSDELEDMKRRLRNRKIICENAGSIAEASLQLNGVFEAAQNAARQYLENIERMSAERDKQKADLLAEIKQEADCIIKEAENYRDTLHKEADEYWKCVYDKAQALLKEIESQKSSDLIEGE